MRWLAPSFALSLGLIAAPVAAQDVQRVRTVDIVDDTSLADLADQYPQEAADYRQHCGANLPQFAPDETDPVRITFDPSGDIAVLAICFDTYKLARANTVGSIKTALLVMSDRDFAPMWEAAEGKWGNDLSLLRARIAASGPELANTMFENSLDERTSEALRLSDVRYGIGDYEGALEVVELSSLEFEGQSPSKLRELEFEASMLAIRRGVMLAKIGGDLAGADFLADPIPAIPEESRYFVNVEINRAAFLAEGGRHAEALALIAPLFERYKGQSFSSTTYSVGGSDREFLWIIACASHGVGDQAAADRLSAMVHAAPAAPADQYLPRTKHSSGIRLRMAACMNDPEGWFGVFRDEDTGRYNDVWLQLQPHYFNPNDMPEGFTIPEDIAVIFAERYRILPESYNPALRLWRVEGTAP